MNKRRFARCSLFVLLASLHATAPAGGFNGTGVGDIPDGTSNTCGLTAMGEPLVISFNVSGLGSNVGSVEVRLTASPTHPWVGDLYATLRAPGGSPSADLFGNTGDAVDTAASDDSDFTGPYTFGDAQTGNWWSAAAAAGATTAVPSGGYRATNRFSATATSLNAVFAGLTPAQANGVWTLTITDDCAQDRGAISSAVLELTTVTEDIFRDGFEDAPLR